MENGFLDKFKFLERNQMGLSQKTAKFLERGAVEIEPILKAKKKNAIAAKQLMKTE